MAPVIKVAGRNSTSGKGSWPPWHLRTYDLYKADTESITLNYLPTAAAAAAAAATSAAVAAPTAAAATARRWMVRRSAVTRR